jgi:hypothetical protein
MNKAITFQQQLWGINGLYKSVGYKSIEQSPRQPSMFLLLPVPWRTFQKRYVTLPQICVSQCNTAKCRVHGGENNNFEISGNVCLPNALSHVRQQLLDLLECLRHDRKSSVLNISENRLSVHST